MEWGKGRGQNVVPHWECGRAIARLCLQLDDFVCCGVIPCFRGAEAVGSDADERPRLFLKVSVDCGRDKGGQDEAMSQWGTGTGAGYNAPCTYVAPWSAVSYKHTMFTNDLWANELNISAPLQKVPID